jgi:hypothetical protein
MARLEPGEEVLDQMPRLVEVTVEVAPWPAAVISARCWWLCRGCTIQFGVGDDHRCEALVRRGK